MRLMYEKKTQTNLLTLRLMVRKMQYFEGIRTCLGASNDRIFLCISSNSCPPNLLLARSHQAEIIIVKYLIQGRNNVTSVRVELKLCDHGGPKTTPLPSPLHIHQKR